MNRPPWARWHLALNPAVFFRYSGNALPLPGGDRFAARPASDGEFFVTASQLQRQQRLLVALDRVLRDRLQNAVAVAQPTMKSPGISKAC
jgi:hypothetical protein